LVAVRVAPRLGRASGPPANPAVVAAAAKPATTNAAAALFTSVSLALSQKAVKHVAERRIRIREADERAHDEAAIRRDLKALI
jgi:hypothetical protein